MLFITYYELSNDGETGEIIEAGNQLLEAGMWPPDGMEISGGIRPLMAGRIDSQSRRLRNDVLSNNHVAGVSARNVRRDQDRPSITRRRNNDEGRNPPRGVSPARLTWLIRFADSRAAPIVMAAAPRP